MVDRGVKSEIGGGGDSLFLPPGFRFHPTDEEVITSYLLQKFLNPSFDPQAIGEVDLNKCEPWDLPSKAKMGEKEWYFFCHKDMKYPTGMRTNRATKEGYWKATGKDREIFAGRELVGMKKTLVFYTGRAPRGSKTNWVMHEFRLEGKYRNNANLRFNPKDEWVVCKVHRKNGEPAAATSRKAAEAAAEHSAGTPNVSSVEAGDEFLNDDDSIMLADADPVSLFFGSAAAGSFPTSATQFDAAAAPYNVDYSTIFSAAAATTTSTSSSGLVDLPAANNYRLNQAVAAVANSAAPTYSSSWNMPHAAGSNQATGGSYSLQHQHQQAMAAAKAALGGGVVAAPDFAAAGLLPSVAGISHQSSQLGAPPPQLQKQLGNSYGAYHASSSAAAASKNLGARPGLY